MRLRLERDFGLAAFVFAPQMPLSSYKGNLQQNMRLFRLRKFLEWCFENEVSYLALGHTRDDQIETHLLQEAGLLRGRGGMRAKRSAGVCGQGQEQKKEVFLLRPLLSTSKASLQAWLIDGGVGWLEDPSNASPCYARNRIRPVCARLSQAEQSRLLASCATLREEEERLEEAVRSFARAHATWHAEGYIRIESRAFLALDEKVALKVLASVARSVGGKGVRRRQVERVGGAWHRCLEIFLHNSKNAEIDKRIDKKESAVFSLGRCLLFAKGRVFFATRAKLRIAPLAVARALSQDGLWDGRLRILAPLRAPSCCASSFAGWTCEPLGREGVVLVRRGERGLAGGGGGERRRRGEARLERSLARFEELPWRVREVVPSFWREEKLCALPTLGVVVQEGCCLSKRGCEGLPRVRFVGAEERNLCLPTLRINEDREEATRER